MAKDASDEDLVREHNRKRKLREIADKEYESAVRTAFLKSAAATKPTHKPALWEDDEKHLILPVGELSILNGHGGLAKSTILCWLAARLSRGELPGVYFGTPKSVIMDMREDDWKSITIPRLIAAGADMNRIFEPELLDTTTAGLVLPEFPIDAERIADLATHYDVALYCVDPLPSSMSRSLRQEKGQDVRTAFQPLMRAGRAVNMATLGIAHNKKDESNPITAISGAAFRDLARAVLSVTESPGGNRKLIGITKSNYGRDDLPARFYDIRTAWIGIDDPKYPFVKSTETTFIELGEVCGESIADAMEQNSGSASIRDASVECKDWLNDYLRSQSGHEAKSSDLFKIARIDGGFTPDQLRTAKKKLGVVAVKSGMHWIWKIGSHGA